MTANHYSASAMTAAQAIALELAMAHIAAGGPVPTFETLALELNAVLLAADRALA